MLLPIQPARRLGLIALFFWVSALPMTVFTLYSQHKQLTGIDILASGWLSPLILNFAWFANVFFLLGIVRLLKGGTPFKAAICAALLSLDTIRIAVVMLDEGGGSSPIYGYGWGCVLWFVSIFLLLIAVGQQLTDKDAAAGVSGFGSLLRSCGLLLIFLTLGTTAYFTTHDHSEANAAETRRLQNIAFKRGKVCKIPDPVVTQPIPSITGPLEVVIEKGVLHARYPFAQVKELLQWGIPRVRIGDTDYSMLAGVFNSVTATGEPAAILTVTESRSIRARLLETASNRVVFDHTWFREDLPANEQHYCPDYETGASTPKQLLAQALGLESTTARRELAQSEPLTTTQIAGAIIEIKEDGETTDKKFARWKAAHPDQKGTLPSHDNFNTNCPDEVGWDGRNYQPETNTGWPFRIGDQAYYPGNREYYNAICKGDFAYLYSSAFLRGKRSLLVEKRSLVDFRKLWQININLPDTDESGYDNQLRVQAVAERATKLQLELVNDRKGTVLVVEAPLNPW